MLPFFAIIALMLVPSALAGPGDYAAGEPATGYHTQSKMTRATDGTLFYTFLENESVVVARAGGERLPSVQAARGGQSRSSITLDASGTLHLAWTERADEDREVFAARFVDGAWAGVTQLSRGEGYAGFPSLAADGAGRVHVAWYGFDGDVYQTFHRAWEDGAWGAPTQLSAGPLDANNPSLVVDADGNAHVAWYKDEGRRYSVWYARRDANGTWSLAERLPHGDADALNVALAIDAGGTLHAVWDERHDDGTHVQHATRDAGAWSRATTIAGAGVGGEYPAIAARGAGVVVAWTAPNGTIVATGLDAPAQPLLEGARGTHVSLRGMRSAPEGDRDATLDVLYTGADGSPRLTSLAASTGERETPWPIGLVLLACLLALRRRTGR